MILDILLMVLVTVMLVCSLMGSRAAFWYGYWHGRQDQLRFRFTQPKNQFLKSKNEEKFYNGHLKKAEAELKKAFDEGVLGKGKK